MDIPGYLTIRQAATQLGVHHSQVCRYCRAGDLPAKKLLNIWLIRKADLAKFVPRPAGNPNFQHTA